MERKKGRTFHDARSLTNSYSSRLAVPLSFLLSPKSIQVPGCLWLSGMETTPVHATWKASLSCCSSVMQLSRSSTTITCHDQYVDRCSLPAGASLIAQAYRLRLMSNKSSHRSQHQGQSSKGLSALTSCTIQPSKLSDFLQVNTPNYTQDGNTVLNGHAPLYPAKIVRPDVSQDRTKTLTDTCLAIQTCQTFPRPRPLAASQPVTSKLAGKTNTIRTDSESVADLKQSTAF